MKRASAIVLLPYCLCRWLEASDLFESRIAPDMSVVTEISSTAPFVGQQIGVAYRLRAQLPPAAVDVDPQQFTGFWLESVPQSNFGAAVPQQGGQNDYLLRRVILFPLYAGEIDVPPLRVKVKRSAAGGLPGEWDIVGASAPLTLRVAGVGPDARGRRAMVGKISGRMFEEVRGGAGIFFLELSGTANLALFDPAEWLEIPGGHRIAVRQVDYRSDPEPAGRPDGAPAVRMQRRWELRVPAERGIPELSVPVLDPARGRLESVRIASPLSPVSGSVAAPTGSNPGDVFGAAWRWWGAFGFLGAFALLLAGALIWRRRRTAPGRGASSAILRKLVEEGVKMQHAPRPYFETAQRALQRCEREFIDDRLVQAKASACRNAVERWRFSPASPPEVDRREIVTLLRELLDACEHSSGGGMQGRSGAASHARSPMLL